MRAFIQEKYNQMVVLEKNVADELGKLETKILNEIKEYITSEKSTAIGTLIEDLSGLILVKTTDNSLGEAEDVIIDIEALDNFIDNRERESEDNCTICLDYPLDIVTLPCKHRYCRPCFLIYLKDRIFSKMEKCSLEQIAIPCPNCQRKYSYLDELDDWLMNNGFDLTEFWTGLDLDF